MLGECIAQLSSSRSTSYFFLFVACFLCSLPLNVASFLQVNTTLLQRSGDSILVSWSNVQPSPSDNITVTANNLTILSFSVTDSPTWSLGNGSLAIRLVSIYAPLSVTYTSHLGILAQSPVIIFSDPNEPLFPRLSLLGDSSNTLVLTWTSAGYTGIERVLARPSGCEHCDFKEFPLLSGGNITYSVDDMCGGIAKGKGWMEPGVQLSAALVGLAPSSEYEYVYGTADSQSRVSLLRTPPASNSTSTVHVFLFGDMGVAAAPPNGFPASLSTVNSILLSAANTSVEEYTSVLHIGDISYAMGFQFYWPLFLDQIQPLASRAIYQLSIGNHELCWPGVGFRPTWGDYGQDSGGECGVPFLSRFFLPNNRLWYSYNMGAVHFTVTSSEHDYTPGSDQHDWVLSDLSAVDRSVTPWIVFTSHRPLYTAACAALPLQHACQIESPVFQALQDAWEDVLIQYNVTLAATAHIHYYERTCAVAHGVCVNSSSLASSQHAASPDSVQPRPAPIGAPIYVVVGPAGAPITPLPEPPHPSWTASLIDVFGFSVIHANASHFHFQFIADGSRQVLDEFIFTARGNGRVK